MTKQECILCAQQAQFIGVGECNHSPFCYRCIYKMRALSKNSLCPICKFDCKQMIIMPEFIPFSSIKKNDLLVDKTYGDIYYVNEEGKRAFQKLTEYKCFLKVNGKPCKNDKKFPSIAFLKKHLKEEHQRHICDICQQKKTCVLQEQKLYSFNNLNKHMQRGDIDEFGNIVFLHPYCGFCKRYFFDDDAFKLHINLQHIICNVCGSHQKYRYYKNYDSLETHYKISHYICNEADCLDKKFIAFRNADQLKLHRLQIHDRNQGKVDVRQLCGFQYQGHTVDDQKFIIKDKQGINMENQFLALKKSKNRTLAQADQQLDQVFDIRDFYNCGYDEDQHLEKISKKSIQQRQHKPQQKKDETQKKVQQANSQAQKLDNKKKKYISKKDLEKQQYQKPKKPQQTLQKQKSQQNFYFQDLLIVQSLHFTKLTNQQFDSKLRPLVKMDELNKFMDLRFKLFKRKIKQDEFIAEYFKIFRYSKLSYNILPHFLRTIIHDDNKYELDQKYLQQLKKLPFKIDNLLKTSNKYSDFFNKFLKQLENNIEYRIKNNILSLKKTVKKNKQRIYQIVGVVRRIKIQQMAKLKFATNFGLKKDTVDFIVNKIFIRNIKEIQQKLDKIQNQEFLDLYVFVKYCYQAIKHANIMHIEKHKIHQNILQDFLYQRPHLEQKYGLKKQQLKTMQEKVQFQKFQQQKKAKKQLKDMQKKNQQYGFSTKTDFNLGDKGDFPQLVIGQKSSQQRKQTNLKDLVSDNKSKPLTYQKKINQLFPTMGQQLPTNLGKKKSSEVEVKEEKKEKAWWEKINQKKKNQDEEQEPEVVKVRQGKNKKEKWVSVKMDGLFGK